MRRLRDEIGESVHLYIRDEDSRICIAAVEARHELRPFIQLGGRCRCGRAPRARSCWRSPMSDIQRRELERATDDRLGVPAHPVPTWLASSSASASERWATSVGEREDDVAAIAATVDDSTGRVVAALCISGPTTRLDAPALRGHATALTAAADEISGSLRRG